MAAAAEEADAEPFMKSAICIAQARSRRIPAMSVQKSEISTPNAPAAIGPYSQAIQIEDLVFTSGQVGLDPETGQLVAGGIAEQTTQVIENLKAVLSAAECPLANVVKTTVFLKDMNDFAAMNEIYGRYFAPEGTTAPARSTVEVSRLPKDALVEIELIARL
jgi:2-iminobutanoate/2-iminopropanoate deaminase